MKNNHVLRTLSVIFGFLALAALIFGAFGTVRAASDWYVRTDGSDVNCDGTLDLADTGIPASACAFKTIQKGIDAAVDGDTVHVGAGTYSESKGGYRDIELFKGINLVGAGSGATIVELSNLQHGMEVRGTAATTLVQGMAFTKMPANTNSAGWAVVVEDVGSSFTKLTFKDVEIAYASGRNLYLGNNTYTEVVLDGVNIHDAYNPSSSVWGMSARGTITKMTVSGSHFDHNIGGIGTPGAKLRGIGFDFDMPTVVNNVTVTDSTFNSNNGKGINLTRTSNITFSNIEASNNTTDGDGGIGICLWEWSGTTDKLTIENSNITGNATDGILLGADPGKTVSNLTIKNVVATGNGQSGIFLWNAGGTFSNLSAKYSNFSGNGSWGVYSNYSASPIAGTCNWWGDLSGPTVGSNPGGLGRGVANVVYSPWLVYDIDGNAARGYQQPAAFSVTAGADTSAADNGYRRLSNALGCVVDGQTIDLSGTFDISQPNAKASWALGNDAVTGTGYTDDDYVVDVKASRNVTLTAASLGAATIQGPGDEPSVDLEGFLQFYKVGTGDFQGWKVSNLQIYDFDVAIGMYYDTTDEFDNVVIDNNHIRVATDVKGGLTSSDPEAYQNIGIHYAFGSNQQITNNVIDLPGNGVSDPGASDTNWWMYSSTVGMQSNTSGGAVYDGLLVDHNTINVLNAQSAYPEKIRGFWENSHGHTSNIVVSNNTFKNLAPGNNPALNLQQAFRVTSHSSATTTVAYTGNLVEGANVGFWWLDVSAGLQPVQLTGNTVKNTAVGFRVRNNGKATLVNNNLYGNGTGVLVEDSATATINNNSLIGNSVFGVNNTTATLVDASNNFWGSCDGPGPLGPGHGDKVSANVTYAPFTTAMAANTLQTLADSAAPGATIQLGACTYNGATITRPLTILGLGPTLSPTTVVTQGSPAFVINAPDVTIADMVIDGDPLGTTPAAFDAVVVNAGGDNLILQNTYITDWANAVHLTADVTSFKLVNNWIHDNTAAGLLIDTGVDLGGVVTVQGNLFKENAGPGIQNDSATPLNAQYNSWGNINGAAAGDGVSGTVDVSKPTFSEVFVDVKPDTLATVVDVNEGAVFNVAVKVDAANLYAVQYKLTYDPAYLTFQTISDGSFKNATNGSCTNTTSTPGVISVYCTRFSPATEVNNASGETISTIAFLASNSLVGNGPWDTYLDLSTAPADLSTGAKGGIKVFVNNGGFGADSGKPGHTITDADDGKIIIHGLANFTGYIDLEGRANDSGATINVWNQLDKAGAVEYARGSSVSSGKYTTAYLGSYQLNIPTTYYFQVDAPLFLPTTAMVLSPSYQTVPTIWWNGDVLDTRPLHSLLLVKLLGGDANDNNVIETSDLGCIGGAYGGAPAACGAGTSDVNGDGRVDIYDLVLMGGNYDKTFSSWGQVP